VTYVVTMRRMDRSEFAVEVKAKSKQQARIRANRLHNYGRMDEIANAVEVKEKKR